MADQYNSAHTGAEIDQAVSDVQSKKSSWNAKIDNPDTKSDGQALIYNGTTGKWEAKTPEAGAEFFDVTLTTDGHSDGYYQDVPADKTFAEILAAYQAGKIVRVKWGNWVLHPVIMYENLLAFAAFEGGTDVPTELYGVTATCDADDVWEIGKYTNSIPEASDTVPKANGTASAGSAYEYARGDHVHPSDDTKQAKINVLGIFKGYGNGSVVRASPGTDYISPANLDTRLHRTTNVHAADTNYTTLMARGESLNAAEVTPAVNGAIAWVYG